MKTGNISSEFVGEEYPLGSVFVRVLEARKCSSFQETDKMTVSNGAE